jgi:hypothetical protein
MGMKRFRGGIYTGQFTEDLRDGHGKYQWNKKGQVYEGDWYLGQRTGKGYLRCADGSTYDGSFVNGKRHGRGIYTNVKGDVYDGEWKDDKKFGEGA